MSAKQALTAVRDVVQEQKEKGERSIDCDSLIRYLTTIAEPLADVSEAVNLERAKAELQREAEIGRFDSEMRLEMFRSVITAGQGAIRSSMILNGGASVALIAFIGHLVQFSPRNIQPFASSLVFFACGVFSIALVGGLTYLSQWLFASNRKAAQDWGFILNLACIVVGVLSYVFFGAGLYLAYGGFLGFR